MIPTWQCATCLVLNWAPGNCRSCGRGRLQPAPLRVAPRRTMLSLPRHDFPYSRTHRSRAALGTWVLPALLFAASIAVATLWNPVTAGLTASWLRDTDRASAWAARESDLARAVELLRGLHGELARATLPGAPGLAEDWPDRLGHVTRRYALHGATADPALADDEVAARVVALELYSLHRRYTTDSLDADARRHLAAAARELDLISEDLAHAP